MKQLWRPTRSCLLTCVFLTLLLISAACGTQETGSESDTNGGGTEQVLAAQDLENLETFDDIPVGFTEEGYPFRGDPDAPVIVIEFSDYLCPFCGRYSNNTLPTLLEDYARTGKVRFVFRDFPLESLHPTADIGHAAALCVAEQGADLYWRMHDQLYLRQSQWNTLNDPTEFLAKVAGEIGADMNDYSECVESGRKVQDVADSVEEGFGLGFSATPSFQFKRADSDEVHTFIGAQPLSAFAGWFDALYEDGEPPVEPTPEPQQLPLWATAEGLAPDTGRPGFTIAGDHYKGDPDAGIVVVEFTDFQCPACASHTLEIQDEIDEALVETGEVMWVSKHLPLRIHRWATIAGAAAECAADQGMFWEMHHLLFERQGEWSGDEIDEETIDQALLDLAAELDLDEEVFAGCFSSREALERVIRDLFDAQDAGLSGTPSFVIFVDGRGTLIQRSMPADDFISTIRDIGEGTATGG